MLVRSSIIVSKRGHDGCYLTRRGISPTPKFSQPPLTKHVQGQFFRQVIPPAHIGTNNIQANCLNNYSNILPSYQKQFLLVPPPLNSGGVEISSVSTLNIHSVTPNDGISISSKIYSSSNSNKRHALLKDIDLAINITDTAEVEICNRNLISQFVLVTFNTNARVRKFVGHVRPFQT